MSAQEEVVITFNIAENSLSKLEKIMSGGSSGGSKGSSGNKGIGGLQDVMNKGSMGQIAKLSGIAIGVVGVVGLVKKITSLMIQSSPMLQSMLKLFQVGLMFVLRPIGDFIGFLLRPIMIYLLRTVFIPWYRLMQPLMKTWGTEMGGKLLEFIQHPLATLHDMLANADWGFIAIQLVKWWSGVTIVELLTKLLAKLGVTDVDSATTFVLGTEFKDQIFQAGVDAAEYWRQAGRDSAAYWRDMGTEAGNAIRQAGVDAAAWWRALGQATGDVFRDAGKAVGDTIFGLGVAFGNWTTSMVSDLRVIGDDIAAGIDVVFTGINDAWNNLIPSIEGTVSTIGSALSGFGSFLMVNLGGIGNFIYPYIESFVGVFRDTLGTIWNTIGGGYNQFIALFGSFERTVGTLTRIWDMLVGWFEGIEDTLKNLDIGGMFSNAGETISSGIANMFNTENNNSVNLNVDGSNNGFNLDDLQRTVLGWLEDSNSKR